MSFFSVEFWFLLFISVPLYYLVPYNKRWILLLCVSFIFYLENSIFCTLILLIAIITDYYFAVLISKHKKHGRKILFVSIILSVLLLLTFKYNNLFNSISNYLFNSNFSGNFILAGYSVPVGISFYTFKKISYIIDVYNENQKAEFNLGKFALYISFFPEILSGPIDRSKNLIPQFAKKIIVDYGNLTDGLRLILFGLFKKIVIADRLAIMVNEVYNNPYDYHGVTLILATYFFAFQIYADFSGYTDIAIGVAKLFGIEIPENFVKPYNSRSIQEFWRRWHITLSNWLRDYIFLPLAYIFVRKFQKIKNISFKPESLSYVMSILVTWFVGGLWHGSKVTFIIWGLLQGIYLGTSFVTRKLRKKINRKLINKFISERFADLLRLAFTFNIIAFAWIFFRADSFESAAYIVVNAFRYIEFSLANIIIGFTKTDFIISILGILMLIAVDNIPGNLITWFEKKSTAIRWSIYYALIFSIILIGIYQHSTFIYLNF